MPRHILSLLGLLFLGAGTQTTGAAEDVPPNVVLIISDDQAWTDYGFMGHPAIQTPHLDRLAAESVVFRRGYVPTALCRPSLLTLATGHYAHKHGVTGNDPSPKHAGPATPLYAERRATLISYIERFDTLPELLAKRGYLSHQSGKWWEGGFAHGGFTHGMTRGFPRPGGRHGDDGLRIGREGMRPIERFVETAVEAEKPFFLWYAPFLPHTPHNPPERLLEKYRQDGRPLPIARYYAMCEWFDQTCGQLLGILDAKDVRDNTLVVYVTDNGWIQSPTGRGYAPRSKQTPYEGGVRTPIMFSWPGRLEGATRLEPVSSIDLVPTILSAAGLTVPDGLPGLNLWPILTGAKPIDRDAIFGESFAHDIADVADPEASLLYRWCIEGKWKLLLTYDGEVNRYKSTHPRDEKGPQLFDLSKDPHEKKNVATEHPEVVARLAKRIAGWYEVKTRKTRTAKNDETLPPPAPRPIPLPTTDGLTPVAVFEPPVAVTFDYPRLRLTLAAVADVGGRQGEDAAEAIKQLDSLFDAMLRAGDAPETEASRRLRDEVAKIETLFDTKSTLTKLHSADPEACMRLMIQLDWVDQDTQDGPADSFVALASGVLARLEKLDPRDAAWRKRFDGLAGGKVRPSDARWMQLYLDACHERRERRMGPHVAKFPRIVFTKHHDIGGQHYAYTEDVSDSPYRDNNPFPNTGKLCLLEMDGLYGKSRVLVDEPNGLVRDPDVSYDGRRILFAWRKSMDKDDYHLYEMDAADGTVRQITAGAGVADYEGVYLPSGDILFNSSRCQQIVDCWWADVSNLYTCAADGRFLRRLSFDQVHTNYPQVMPDGRVVYTRWDYNDRGQLYPQPLFQMNPDGTAQTEFYGNNSWFPTTILHARGIPGTNKVLCVLSGHHTYQKGKLAIIDPSRGRQEASGVQLIAPVRKTEAVKVDMYGAQGHQFQYPFPLSETEYLVTFSIKGSKKGRARAEKPFGIYFMSIDGRRELLAADPGISCSQSIPLAPRPIPPVQPSRVDYRKTTGVYSIQDVYRGPGLAGIERGTVERIRVVALEFRAAGVGSGRNNGPAGGALVSTPISINGAWDVKRVLGTAPVYEDGSAAFTVPARTPVYFQALDAKGHVVQTMRSWSTLQPGETFSCVGCHEEKNSSPPADAPLTLALRTGPQPLEPEHGSPAGFSFPKLVQPILDKHCVRCHDRKAVAAKKSTISLEGAGELDGRAQKVWSDAYKTLANRKFADWVSPQSAPPMLPPYHAGAAKSRSIALLDEGHEDVKLTPAERGTLACWIDLAVPFSGDYTEGMPDDQVAKYQVYLDKRLKHAAEEEAAIEELLKRQ